MEINIVKLYNIVNSLLKWCRDDIKANESTLTESWLYTNFHDVNLNDSNFYDELLSVLTFGEDDNRMLRVRLMFDKERASLPTIHIHYPSEDGNSGNNSLGTGTSGIEVVNDKGIEKFSRSFIGQYELIITGGNSLEVVFLYEFLDALLIAAADTLAFNFDIFKFSGKQLLSDNTIIPNLTFYRAIGMSLQNRKVVTSIIKRNLPSGINFESTLY